MTDTLKVCPFCGGVKSIPVHDFLKGWVTECVSCGKYHEDFGVPEVKAKVGSFDKFTFPLVKAKFPRIDIK